ncbi:hypothetical protein VIGAN_UM191600 [Vigna angularis var. angularis]|uniref:EF-hand domain-containing protein n=1 Tax=Vigna angularis var. angularis TaxID=157739 RepID=A0A0S3TFF4_PHAAN|nr:hypothetical protein VIGAN_UM191600 [Vigna angularis var. angularis]
MNVDYGGSNVNRRSITGYYTLLDGNPVTWRETNMWWPNLVLKQDFGFKCIDLDGNGVLTPNEMQFFYEEQLHRMECMAQEPVLFEDILCQIVDMIGPEEREDPNLTEWDRFAHREYIRLSMEEDGEDMSNASGDVWEESLEAPF